MVRTPRVVPKEWAKYTPLGRVIPHTRFLVFKTPLNESLNNRLPHDRHFTLNDLYRQLAERNERLGLIVDLTDTTRYYDRRDVEGMCIEYEKVYCPGRGFVDREDVVETFNSAIHKFIAKNDDPQALIGIHCTRGVNRSGYLVCRFLIDCLGWSSHEAIDAFGKARGYPIEKGGYIAALHKAAKESRNRPTGKEVHDSDSGESAEEARKKRKRKAKDNNDMDGNAAQMGTMIKHFLGVLGQEASQIDAESSSPALVSSPYIDGPKTGSETHSPAIRGDDDEFDDGDEDWDGEDAKGGQVDGYEAVDPASAAAKRRQRRKRLNNMFHVMKRGNFHEIQDMQTQMYK